MMGIGQFDYTVVASASNISIASLVEKSLLQQVSRENLGTILNMYNIEDNLNTVAKKIYDIWVATGKTLKLKTGLFKSQEVAVELVQMPKIEGNARTALIDALYNTYMVPEFEQVEKKYLIQDILNIGFCPYIKFKAGDEEYALVLKVPYLISAEEAVHYDVESRFGNLDKSIAVAITNIEKMAARVGDIGLWNIGDNCKIASKAELGMIKMGGVSDIEVSVTTAGTAVFKELKDLSIRGQQGTGKTTLMRGVFGVFSPNHIQIHDGEFKVFTTTYLYTDNNLGKRVAWASVLEEWAREVRLAHLSNCDNILL